MHWLTAVFFLLFVVITSAFGDGQTTEKSCYKVSEVMAEISPTLIGGVPADPAEFPASVWIGNCTAAIAGERVLITAAHCVNNGGSKAFSVGPNTYAAKCTHHPAYRGNSTADWAICLVDRKVEGVPYEKVATQIEYKIGDELLLSGFGCTKWGGGIPKLVYRIGKSPVIRLPSGSNYDTVTRSSVALCSGDSGGPAWLVKEDGDRFLVGVNSRSDTTVTSYLSSHAVQTAQSFYKDWALKNKVEICGIHDTAVGCRNTTPPIPNSFTVEGVVGSAAVKLNKGFEEMLEGLKLKIEALLTQQD